MDFMMYFISFLPGTWTFELSTFYQPYYPPSVIDLRRGVPCGISQHEVNRFPTYAQVQRIHKMHQPNLSILDALCHLGPETSEYLAQYAIKLYEKP
jgi:hypothetical protein